MGEDGRSVPPHAGQRPSASSSVPLPSRPSRRSTASCPSGLPTSPCLTLPSRLSDQAVMMVFAFACRRASPSPVRWLSRASSRPMASPFASAPRSEAAANAKEVPGPHGVCAGPARGHLRRAGHWRSRHRSRAGRCRRVRAASVRWRVCRLGHGAREPVFRRCHLHARDRHCARGARRPCLRLSQAQDRRQGPC